MGEKQKEILITKWLDGSLTQEELKQFKQLPEYDEYVKLSKASRYFSAPEFDIQTSFETVRSQTVRKNTASSRSWFQIAAAIVVLIAVGGFIISQFSQKNIIYSTEIAQTKTILLPDNSEVILNAQSSISYNEDTWEEKRFVTLEGEAFFKVEKGSTFQVHSDQGVVTVLGTQFNVKDRGNLYQVLTFEGLVGIVSGELNTKIAAGEGIQSIENKTQKTVAHSTLKMPTWIEKMSTFESTPYRQVVEELERQYNLTINLDNANEQTLFTGSFTHTNLQKALQSITVPMQLNYVIEGTTVTLSKQ